MSHGKLREDTTCQNCGDEVKVRFCPTCGQENTETKKSFHYLFTHFLEDLVHYDNSFWKAIKYLLYAPEKLSLVYLSGKRKAFMAPVRLFIFINIISFIIFSSFTFKELEHELNPELGQTEVQVDNELEEKELNKNTVHVKLNESYLSRKMDKLEDNYTEEQIFQKVLQKVFQNLPKFLFLVMPFFALSLWLTHNKKKWWYFDHGIFTFHYFSSFLLLLCITTIINQILGFFNYETNGVFIGLIYLYLNFLFIKAFVCFYQESKLKNIVKLVVVYFLNSLIFLFVLVVFSIYILYIL
jgi:hypothetical protein